ncbi:MAG TPA: hypothetical protein VFS66_11795 [Acidimicrobiia bacterium]|nr:hypothetical protein [Acidimicrobiia bacterium]
MRWFLIVAVVVGVVACTESSVPTTTEPPDVTSSTAQEPAPERSTTSTGLTPTTTTLPATFAATRSTIGLGWEAVEVPTPVVARCHRALVGTDEELIFWGGNQQDCEYESPTGNPAMAYHPASGMWRQLPESPMEPVVAPTGVWTGSEVILCCGMTSRQAAAYDPATDTWRTLAESPLGGPFPEARWTGEEMVVMTQTGAAAYNPTTDSWREFPPMPEDLGRTNEIEWTGSELVVWPRFPVGDPLRRVEEGMALDPSTGTWRVLPDPQPWPSWVDMVVTDDSIIIWGGLPANQGGSERAVGARYDLNLGTWRPVPEALPEPDGCECNLGSQTLTWTGEYVLVSPGMFSTGVDPDTPMLIAYHPATDSWILVDEESPLAWGGDSLTVGERLVIVANDVFYTSPPNWQPTGETITQRSWGD